MGRAFLCGQGVRAEPRGLRALAARGALASAVERGVCEHPLEGAFAGAANAVVALSTGTVPPPLLLCAVSGVGVPLFFMGGWFLGGLAPDGD